MPSPNYRGVHRLNKDEEGRVKWWRACYAPRHARRTVSISSGRPPRQAGRTGKNTPELVIDELRSIYCGMCEEACPVEAIELTGLYDLTGLSREQMIFDKTKLLSVFDATCNTEPMRFGKPPAEVGRDADPAVAGSLKIIAERSGMET